MLLNPKLLSNINKSIEAKGHQKKTYTFYKCSDT